MTDPIVTLEVARDGAVVVAGLTGEIDLSNGRCLRERILGECLAARALVLDLREVTYMDSAGLALVDGLAGDLAGAGGRLLVVAPEGCAAGRALELSGLAVARHDDLGAALEGARG